MKFSFKGPGGINIVVSRETPFPVANPPLADQKVSIPGIGTAAAYAAGDAFGTIFSFPVPVNCTINNVTLLDYDDEGIRKDLVIFKAPFVPTADNAAFAPSDADLASCLGVLSIDLQFNFANNQVGMTQNPISFVAPRGEVWCQLVTQGADNIAAGAIPDIIVVVE